MNYEATDTDWSDEELDSALEGELDTVQQALRLAHIGKASGAVSEETLARYLDNSLPAPERRALEIHLSNNSTTLQRLIALHRETKRMLDPELKIVTVERHYAAEQVDYEAGKAARKQAAEEKAARELGKETDKTGDIPRAASENG